MVGLLATKLQMLVRRATWLALGGLLSWWFVWHLLTEVLERRPSRQLTALAQALVDAAAAPAIALFLGTLAVVLVEGVLLGLAVEAQREQLERLHTPAPPAPRWGCAPGLGRGLLTVAGAYFLLQHSTGWARLDGELHHRLAPFPDLAALIPDLAIVLAFLLGWLALEVWELVSLGLHLWRLKAVRIRAHLPPPEDLPAWGNCPLVVAGLGAAVLGWSLDLSLRAPSWPDVEGERVVLLVELGEDDTIDEVDGVLRRFRTGQPQRAFPRVELGEHGDLAQTWLIEAAASTHEDLIEALRRDRENVDDVTVDLASFEGPMGRVPLNQCQTTRPLSDDPLSTRQLGLRQIQGEGALALLGHQAPRRASRLAIVDTGVQADHPDLPTVSPRESRDPDGHGTMVAGAAAAVAGNGRAIASLNAAGRWVSLEAYPLDALGPHEVAFEVVNAVEDGVQVINLSLAGQGTAPNPVVDAIDYAVRRDVLVVAAAGNGGHRGQDAGEVWPANLPGVLVVSALDEAGERARFSNTTRGVGHAVSAPGSCVPVLTRDGDVQASMGTSLAAPTVAGLAAILRAVSPSLSAAEVRDLLIRTAAERGAGDVGPLIQAEDAIRSAMAGRD